MMDIKQYISSGIIEAYVMGLCTPDEKAEIELQRRQYPELDKAIIEFEISLEKNLLAAAVLPGDTTDQKILQSFRNLQSTADTNIVQPAKIKKMNWLKFAAAASLILLLASAVVNFILLEKTNTQQALIDKEKSSPLPLTDYKVLQQPDITPVAMYGVAPYTLCRCTMFWDKQTGKGFIMIHHLPILSDGNYQLWAMVNGKPISVGIINDKIRDRFIEVQNIPQDALAFTVTLEKTGGAASPTTEDTYLSGKI
jgi:Anti-sigma-K factor rskA